MFRSSDQIEAIIRQWLKDESIKCGRNSDEIDQWTFHTATELTNPRQSGGTECGVFALMFIHLLSHGTQDDIHLIQQQDISDVRKLLRAIVINKGLEIEGTNTSGAKEQECA